MGEGRPMTLGTSPLPYITSIDTHLPTYLPTYLHSELHSRSSSNILLFPPFPLTPDGLPGYPLPKGYKRLYGPWLTFFTASTSANLDDTITAANTVAQAAIKSSIPYLAVVSDPLYPTARTTVTGTVVVADGRPADAMWVLMSTEGVDVVYTVSACA